MVVFRATAQYWSWCSLYCWHTVSSQNINFINNNRLKASERLSCQIASFTPRSSSPVFISSEIPSSECCSSSWNLEENGRPIKTLRLFPLQLNRPSLKQINFKEGRLHLLMLSPAFSLNWDSDRWKNNSHRK